MTTQHALLAAILATFALPAFADDTPHTTDGLRVDSHVNLSYGTSWRTQSADPALLPPGNAGAVGIIGTAAGGNNNDDGDLNYKRGAPFSTVLKGTLDTDIQAGNLGAKIRLYGWNDSAMHDNAVPHGNFPNGYVPNTPLSDRGASALGAFAGLEALQANVYGNFAVADHPLFLRLGYQNIGWGIPTTIAGGLEAIDPTNNPARLRPGATPEESRIPIAALFGRLGVSRTVNAEGFLQFDFRGNELPECGTFFSSLDYLPHGCNQVYTNPAFPDAANAQVLGGTVARASDIKPPKGGQYGLGLTWLAEGVGQFGGYFSNYHSRRQSVSVYNGGIGSPLPLYAMEFPKDIKVWGLTFKTRLPDQTAVAAEYTYRPNQSVQLATSDLLFGFLSPAFRLLTGQGLPSELNADVAALAPGQLYHGYDRLRVSQLNAGVSRPFGQVAGGDLTASAEAGLKYVHDLPDVAVRRYVRSDVFGLGPVGNLCIPPAYATQCTSDGYASAFAWGVRTKVASRYADVLEGIALTPSLSFAWDLRGWSYDGVLSQGRKLANLGVHADIGHDLYADLSWTPTWGGTYNVRSDRSFMSLVGGVHF